jgi:(1->4)-alpha-D-glucan 1-alpha-D-glucosylmutase
MAARAGQPSAVPAAPIPQSTYRLQLQPGFGFADAAGIAGYLATLGVTHAYLSPILQAAPGSVHGYDVVDHSRVSADLGGEGAFRDMVAQFRRHGLGVIADIVPNHMAIPIPESLNRQFWSVLRDGDGSPFAHWFDIDWAAGGGRLLLPILAGPLAGCLGDLAVGADGPDGPVLRYQEHVLPVRPGTEHLPLPDLTAAQHYRLAGWRSAATELNWRRFFDVTSLIAVRVEDEDVFAATHGLLLRLMDEGLIDGLRVDHPDGLADPRGYLDRLAKATGGAWVVTEKILTRTEKLPQDWRCAGTTGYDALGAVGGLFLDPGGAGPLTTAYTRFTEGTPRFADVAETAKRQVIRHNLAAEVYRLTRLLTHARIPKLTGLSFTDLHAVLTELLTAFPVYRAYVVPGEPPPTASAGFVAAAAASARHRLPPRLRPALAVVAALALGKASGPGLGPSEGRSPGLAGPGPRDEVARAAGHRGVPGHGVRGLGPGETERSPGLAGPRPRDEVARAAGHRGAPGGRSPGLAEFIVRFQQTCGPLMAKGVEDTAFYRWPRLAALNEVGGDPGRLGLSTAEFHAFAGRLARDWPATMTTLSTHDTKRQEDVRARLAVLAEIPEDWAAEVARWRGLARSLTGGQGPEPSIEYLLWQTLVGAWPVSSARIASYLVKAMREAKTRTSWTDPDEGYESAALVFTEAVLGDPGLTAAIAAFAARIAPDARVNSLGAKLVQLTMPGVADVYQGCELTGFSLVDPDNRRPVYYSVRWALLEALDAGSPAADLDAEKLLVTSRALRLRRDHPDWFCGGYAPVTADGPAAGHVAAFRRGDAIIVATRLPIGLRQRGGWADTALDVPAGRWQDVLTGAAHTGPRPLLSDILGRGGGVRASSALRLPVAILIPADA